MESHANVVLVESESIENLDGLIVRTGVAAIINMTAERTEALLPSWPEIFEGDNDG